MRTKEREGNSTAQKSSDKLICVNFNKKDYVLEMPGNRPGVLIGLPVECKLWHSSVLSGSVADGTLEARFVNVGECFALWLGRTPRELVGAKFETVSVERGTRIQKIQMEVSKKVLSLLERQVQHVTMSFPNVYKHSAGNLLGVYNTLLLFMDHNGNPTHFFIFVRDFVKLYSEEDAETLLSETNVEIVKEDFQS